MRRAYPIHEETAWTSTLDGERSHDCEPYYLIAELEWDDMPALQKAFQSLEGQAAAQDVPNLDSGTGVLSMVYEVEEV